MKQLIVLIAAASMVYGLQYDGLRVKFGWSDALADQEYFFSIPRTIVSAEKEGWKRLDRGDVRLPELRLYCLMKSKGLCALYDVGGFIAGLQINFPKDDLHSKPIELENIMRLWRVTAPFNDGLNYRQYWYAAQYFVSRESLRAGAGPQMENGATLQDGGVWVRAPDSGLLRIPTTEAELNTTGFKKQNCVPNMGTHYYYEMTPEMKCEKTFPWFALVSEGELIGTGFQIFGKMGDQPIKDFIEHVPHPKASAKATIPNAPPCLAQWADTYGVLSVHIYYVDKPWLIRCKDGDSIKPGNALDRFILNSYRYASQVTDEIKKLFIG